MRKRYFIVIMICFFLIALVIPAIISAKAPDIGESKKYFCDVKVFTLRTDITVKHEDEDIAIIRGNALRFFTDPLSMYDIDGNKIGYGADEFHFITQDSHAIIVNDELTFEMVGNFSILGNKYDIYDKDGELIATAKFNPISTYGSITGTDGSLWADFYSFFYRLDYDVRIKESCQIDDTSVLLMMASFFSDKKADSRSGSSSNSN